VRLDQLAQVRLEQDIRHPETAAGIEHLLGEEEAIGAVEVADSACRLCQEVERPRRGRKRARRCEGHVEMVDGAVVRLIAPMG
jgi:hypothetical protein